MELMIGAAGLISMMAMSLVFQKASYKRIEVKVSK